MERRIKTRSNKGNRSFIIHNEYRILCKCVNKEIRRIKIIIQWNKRVIQWNKIVIKRNKIVI
jgi:hypothetical protein